MQARISKPTSESMPHDNGRPLSDHEQGIWEDIEEQTFLDEERDRLVESPSEVDYSNALNPQDVPPGKQWQEARLWHSKRESAERQDYGEGTHVLPVESLTPDELAVRQRFEEFTKSQEKFKNEYEARQEARPFAVEQAPQDKRGFLRRFTDIFKDRGASYAKVPPTPIGIGVAAIVSVATFPMEYRYSTAK